jgi:hypothetical protein
MNCGVWRMAWRSMEWTKDGGKGVALEEECGGGL